MKKEKGIGTRKKNEGLKIWGGGVLALEVYLYHRSMELGFMGERAKLQMGIRLNLT